MCGPGAQSRQASPWVSSTCPAASSCSASDEHPDDLLARGAGQARPTGRDDPGEGGGTEEHVGEVGLGDPAEHLVDHRLQLVGTGRVGDAGDDPRHRRRGPARLELPRDGDGVGVHPRAEQEQPPQAPGERVARGGRPDLGDGLDALGVGEVQQPVGDLAVGASSWAPRTSSVAARSAASRSSAGSTPDEIASK